LAYSNGQQSATRHRAALTRAALRTTFSLSDNRNSDRHYRKRGKLNNAIAIHNEANRGPEAWPFAQQFAMLPPQQVLRNLY
jgi:hypothetical protein